MLWEADIYAPSPFSTSSLSRLFVSFVLYLFFLILVLLLLFLVIHVYLLPVLLTLLLFTLRIFVLSISVVLVVLLCLLLFIPLVILFSFFSSISSFVSSYYYTSSLSFFFLSSCSVNLYDLHHSDDYVCDCIKCFGGLPDGVFFSLLFLYFDSHSFNIIVTLTSSSWWSLTRELNLIVPHRVKDLIINISPRSHDGICTPPFVRWRLRSSVPNNESVLPTRAGIPQNKKSKRRIRSIVERK